MIVAMLSWYEEPASWLAATVASLNGVASHVVAVDGAYHLTPGSVERPRSGREQADAVVAVAGALGLGLTLILPRASWAGNEVEKRSAMFRAANDVAEPGADWLLTIDADEVVSGAPFDLHERLAAVEEDVAACSLWSRHTDHPEPGEPGVVFDPIYSVDGSARRLYRADPTLRVVGAHYVYVAGPADAPRYLWGHSGVHTLEPCASFPDLKVEHRTKHRGHGRRTIQQGYYRRREELAAEALTSEVAYA